MGIIQIMADYPRGGFPTTMWSLLRRPERESEEVFHKLVGSYRQPIINYLMARGLREHDAEDVSQEVFLKIREESVLEKADASRGRFRSLLVAITRQALADYARHRVALKRGGGTAPISMEALPSEPAIRDPAADDEEFDRLWVWNMVQNALGRLREECAGSGKKFHEALVLLMEEEAPYPEAARRLGTDLPAFYAIVQSARRRLKTILWDMISEYASSEEEYDAEIQIIARYLK